LGICCRERITGYREFPSQKHRWSKEDAYIHSTNQRKLLQEKESLNTSTLALIECIGRVQNLAGIACPSFHTAGEKCKQQRNEVHISYENIYIYTGCPRRNVRDFGRVFLMLNYTDITQNTYIQS